VFPQAEFVNLAGWYHLIAFGLFVPWLAWRGRRRVLGPRPLPNRIAHFRSTAMMLLLFASLSLLVARNEWIDLFPPMEWTSVSVAAAVAMYVGSVVAMRPRWRRAVEKRLRVVYLFMPDTAAERAWWIAVSVLAGVGEEISWRGVQTALLAALTGSYVAAAILTAISFGLGHIVQGWRSAVLIAVFSLGFQALVWLSGSLYLAMAVHIAYDITAGLAYGRLGRALRYTPEDAAATAPAAAGP
jgi:membrane protease YdiL (CAAX protease family)